MQEQDTDRTWQIQKQSIIAFRCTCRDRAYIIEVKSSSTDDRTSNLAALTTSYGALTAPKQNTGKRKGISHILANEKDIHCTQVELVEERKRREAFFCRMHSGIEL